ncbi:MAG: protein kinase domain-containing protein, partial [Bdellovibrionales bacterium]
YMSPEQMRGDPLTHQTDIFSLGIVFWELLAQKKLFTGKTVQEVSNKVKECRVPSVADLNPNIPMELNRICLKALTEQTHMRYKTAAELVSDLNDFLRLMSADGREKSLASAMQNLFPEDLRNLKELLNIHEGMQDGLLRVEATASMRSSNQMSAVKSRHKLRSKKRLDWSFPAAGGAVILACGILYQISPSLIAHFSAFRAPAEVARVQSPQPVPVTPEFAIERKPAWQNEEPVSLTVHANYKARIWVNGRLMGKTAVIDMKVPVGKLVTIKVSNPGSKKAKVRKFTPAPQSRNVYEMGD